MQKKTETNYEQLDLFPDYIPPFEQALIDHLCNPALDATQYNELKSKQTKKQKHDSQEFFERINLSKKIRSK